MKLRASGMASFQAAKSHEKVGASDAEAQAIAQIEKAGGSVRQIAQNDEHREVDFHLQGTACTDEQLAPLPKIKNVVSLNLGKTSVTDAGLTYVKPLTGLIQLHLEQSKVTDKGLAQLKGLVNLTYLNLYGTAVTDAGLGQLTGLKNLRNLYAWHDPCRRQPARKDSHTHGRTDS